MARNRRRYPAEFRAEALRLALRGDRSVAAIARELGVHAEVLRSWVRRHRDTELPSEAAPESLEAENRRLRRENARLIEERDILKKATVYFASGSR
jgi:transposase